MNFSRDVLIAKLGQLQDVIERIQSKRPATLDVLLKDRDIQDILSKNIERAVQICVDIATHIATSSGMSPKTAGEAERAELARVANRNVQFERQVVAASITVDADLLA